MYAAGARLPIWMADQASEQLSYVLDPTFGYKILQAGAAKNAHSGLGSINDIGGLGGQASEGIGDKCHSGGKGGNRNRGCGAGSGGDADEDYDGKDGGPVIQGGTGLDGGGGGGVGGLLSTNGNKGSGFSQKTKNGDGGTGPTGALGGQGSQAINVPGGDGDNGSGGGGGYVANTTPNVCSNGGRGGLLQKYLVNGTLYGPVAGAGGAAGHQNPDNGAAYGANGGFPGAGGGAGYVAFGLGAPGMPSELFLVYTAIA
jgi:hypothetical protein